MKVPTRSSRYSFNLKIFKLHNDKKPNSPNSPPTSPVISAKRNSWRASWRSALGSGSKSKTPANGCDMNGLPEDAVDAAESTLFERSRCYSSSSSASASASTSSASNDQLFPAIQIPQGDELMCKLLPEIRLQKHH